MADGESKQKAERPLFGQPWPGYFHVRRMIRRAKRFQDLVRHRERWSGDVDRAAPLEKLVKGCGNAATHEAIQRIKEEIEKAQHVVFLDLRGSTPVRTSVRWRDPYAAEGEDPEKAYDLILDYFRLPRRSGYEHETFEEVMRCLNNGVGFLEARKRRAFWEMFNPIFWVAWLLRLPITVMERAGFGGSAKGQEMMAAGYVRFVKIAVGVILILACLKLGVEVPWREILHRVIQWSF